MMATVSAATAAPSVLASPTMATPRPIPANLTSIPSLTSLSLISETLATRSEAQAQEVSSRPVMVERALQGVGLSVNGAKSVTESEGDGRMTPLASESGAFSRSDSSSQSDLRASSPHTAISSASNPSLVSQKTSGTSLSSQPAEIGLCSLQNERQLREAASGKDRMFLLLLAREIESFVVKITQDEQPTAVIPQGTASSSTLAAMSASMMVQASFTSSKYQKMLAYKAAEWYGLKGAAGPDGSIIIGLVGQLNSKTPTLRLSEIAPKPPSPKQSFKIMQRNANSDGTNTSRASSTFGDESTKRKTLEEREADYALARQRIYGDAPDTGQAEALANSIDNGQEEEEFDSVPRYPAAVMPNHPVPLEPVYASLVHPPKVDPAMSPPLQPPQAYPSPDQQFAFQTPTAPYSDYAQPSMQPYQVRMPHNGHVPNPQGMIPYNAPQYAPSHNGFGNGHANYAGYGWPQAAPGPYGHMAMRAVSEPPQHMQGQMPMPQMGMNNGWYGHMQFNPGQPMPMIPQGVQYMGQYGPVHQQMYPPLDQPTPMRPHIIPHQQGSAGSSMSSRSYQDISRPHSRGSTTSTRSATSSVRMGYMYPAGAGSVSGYRQGYKAPMFGAMSTLGAMDRRQPRAHSPSSATTISSRSSRVASIVLQPPAPGQHQLPQRPDWAANNVPYHPSAMPHGPKSGPNTSDFPPLHRNGNGVFAEPMQVERAKRSFPSRSASVWSGSNGQAPESPVSPTASSINGVNGNGVVDESVEVPAASITPHPVPTAIAAISPTRQGLEIGAEDVPRRGPVSGSQSTDLSVSDKSIQLSGLSSAGRASEDNPDGMSAQDLIEAKLAALSVSQGIAIGPPPVRAAPASYAKVVRRE